MHRNSKINCRVLHFQLKKYPLADKQVPEDGDEMELNGEPYQHKVMSNNRLASNGMVSHINPNVTEKPKFNGKYFLCATAASYERETRICHEMIIVSRLLSCNILLVINMVYDL